GLARERSSRLSSCLLSTRKFHPSILSLPCRAQGKRFSLRRSAFFICSKHSVWDWTRLNCRTTLSLRRTNICRVERDPWGGGTFGPLHPSDIVKRVSENTVECWRINLIGRTGPVTGFFGIIMLVLPRCLGIIECRRVARKLKLFHH